MRRIRKENVSSALLSLLIPGLGQLEQGRSGIGFLQIAWGFAAVIAFVAAATPGIPRALAVLDLLIVGLWSVSDALIWRPPES